MNLKEEGEKIGAEIYDRLKKDYSGLDYHDLLMLIDNIYSGIFGKIYEQTYYKKRGNEYWKGDDK
jgi:hypothetical protein